MGLLFGRLPAALGIADERANALNIIKQEGTNPPPKATLTTGTHITIKPYNSNDTVMFISALPIETCASIITKTYKSKNYIAASDIMGVFLQIAPARPVTTQKGEISKLKVDTSQRNVTVAPLGGGGYTFELWNCKKIEGPVK